MAALSGPATPSGALASHYPVVCQLSGGMSFTPPLSSDPQNAPPGNVGAVQVSGTLTNCLYAGGDPAPTEGTFGVTVNTAPYKVVYQSYPKRYYDYLNDCAAFSTILKEIKKTDITVTWTGGQGGTTTIGPMSSATPTANQIGEEQITLVGGGRSATGNYASSPIVQLSMSLDNDGITTSPASINDDCSGGSIAAVSFDSATSVGML